MKLDLRARAWPAARKLAVWSWSAGTSATVGAALVAGFAAGVVGTMAGFVLAVMPDAKWAGFLGGIDNAPFARAISFAVCVVAASLLHNCEQGLDWWWSRLTSRAPKES